MNLFFRGLKCLRENGLIYTINNMTSRIVCWIRQKFILHNYYDDLRNRVNNYQNRYPFKPQKTAIRLIWWNFKQLLKKNMDDYQKNPAASKEKTKLNGQEDAFQKKSPPKKMNKTPKIALNRNKVNVVFLLCGGFGDFLIEANYIYKFIEKFYDELLNIDIVPKRSVNTAQFIFEGHLESTINKIYSEEIYKDIMKEYDLIFELSRYPRVMQHNDARIAEKMPELLEYVFLCEKFKIENDRFFSTSPRMDGQSGMISIIQGKKRIQQIDIYNYFKVGKTYEFPLYIKDSDILSKTGLESRPFITIHRGCDERSPMNSVKLWPLEYYNILIGHLKKKYPDMMIVQLGISEDRCQFMCGTDINLIGQTSLTDIAILLSNSIIHIDNEGGMIHLRQALHGGKSIVLFGPTSLEFYGYDENENVCGTGCATWCEWMIFGWQEKCMRGFDCPPCMQSIIPEKVIQCVDKIMLERQTGGKNGNVKD